MPFLPMIELLQPAWEGGYAVPAFGAWNAESMQTILRAAHEMRAPVVLMSGPGEFPVLGPQAMADCARAVAKPFDVPVALHLDHGETMDQVRACLSAGYGSVMLDLSARPFDENVAGLREAVALAHPKGITVEGEIGAIGRVSDETMEGAATTTLTEPDDAARYVEATGVDALAVSIGNAHGIYTALPRFDFERLAVIGKAVDVPLVLHGGSSTPEADLRRAISLGMAKVNVASEICRGFRDALAERWASDTTTWMPCTLADAVAALNPIVRRWCTLCGAEGKA